MPMNTLLHLIPNLLFLTAVLNSGCYRLAFSEIMHKSLHYLCLSPGPVQYNRYTDYVTGWTVRRSNPGGRDIFLAHPDQPWDLPRLLYNGTGSLSQAESGRDVALTTHPYLAPRLAKEYSYTSPPPLGLRGLF